MTEIKNVLVVITDVFGSLRFIQSLSLSDAHLSMAPIPLCKLVSWNSICFVIIFF